MIRAGRKPLNLSQPPIAARLELVDLSGVSR